MMLDAMKEALRTHRIAHAPELHGMKNCKAVRYAVAEIHTRIEINQRIVLENK